jgi:hypothetical protein
MDYWTSTPISLSNTFTGQCLAWASAFENPSSGISLITSDYNSNIEPHHGYSKVDVMTAIWMEKLTVGNSLKSRMLLLATRKPRRAKNLAASKLLRLIAEDMI